MDSFSNVVRYNVSLAFIAIIVTAGAKIQISRLDAKLFSFSYHDCVEKQQWWRMFSSTIFHSSLIHLALDVLTMWDIAIVEGRYGSSFFLKYSLLLIVCQKGCQILFYNVILNYWSQFLPLVRSIHTVGCSGLVFSWLGFLAVASTKEHSTAHIFGVWPVSVIYAPTIMMLVYQVLMPRSAHTLGCLSGLTCGVLLGVGVLEVLSGWYWTCCFVINILLLTLASPVPTNNDMEEISGGLPDVSSNNIAGSDRSVNQFLSDGIFDV